MAISVKNISPEKLTSLLNWFSKNADEIYQNGTPGAKNVLDNALMANAGVGITSPNAFSGVLGNALENVKFNSKYFPMQVDEAQNLYDATLNARTAANVNYTTPSKLTYGLGDVKGVYDYYKNPIELTHNPIGVFSKSLQVPLDIESNNLVGIPDYTTYDTFRRIRPHNNTALGRWYRQQYLPQDFNTPNFIRDIQDLPW